MKSHIVFIAFIISFASLLDVNCSKEKFKINLFEDRNGSVIFDTHQNISSPTHLPIVNQSSVPENGFLNKDCGKLTSDVVQLLSRESNSYEERYPWHALLYYLEGDRWDQICGGTIISSHIIVTAAICVVESKTSEVRKPSSFKVAVGKYFRNWDRDEPNVQRANVRNIVVHDKYSGLSSHYQLDIALIETIEAINFSKVVMPCCIDWKLEMEIKPNQMGDVAGWVRTEYDEPGEMLHSVTVSYLDYQSCIKLLPSNHLPFVTLDKFCATYVNGSMLGRGDAGGGLTFKKDNHYFLQGVLSVRLRENNIVIFTNVTDTYHFHWLKEYLLQSEIGSQNPKFLKQIISSPTHSSLFIKKSVPQNSLHIEEGCSKLVSDTTIFECQFGNNTVNCSETVRTGSIARATCKPTFKYPSGDWPATSACLSNGSWSGQLPNCVQDCGKLIPKMVQPMSHGSNLFAGKASWHVLLYHLRNDQWKHICDGTIISSHIIVTAAHCVTAKSGTTEVKEPSSFKVAVGKYLNTYYDVEEPYVQKANIRNIIVPARYVGRANRYQQDIALIETIETLNFSEVILPCCIDWKLENEIKPNQIGSVEGWDHIGNLKPGEVLQSIPLTYLDYQTCIKLVPKNLIPYITSDKFCVNGSSGFGPGGRGLTFQVGDHYFLQGIASLKSNDLNNSIVIYTNVTDTHHFHWLRENLLKSEWGSQNPELIQKDGECSLPNAEEGTVFLVSGCSPLDISNRCRGLDNIPVPSLTSLEFFCKEGFYFPDRTPSNVICKDEYWIPSVPACKKMCTPLKEKTLIIKCSNKSGQNTSCLNYIMPGSVALFDCEPGYQKNDSTSATCLTTGEWSNYPKSCVPVCGKTIYTHTEYPTEIGWQKVIFFKHPWFIGIYMKSLNGSYSFLCPGTLVNPFTVLTSARCVYNLQQDDVVNPKEIIVAAGKRSINWDSFNEEQETKLVKDILLRDGYNKESYSKFVNDISILILADDYSTEDFHYQSCTDYLKTEQLPSLGTVTGWGIHSESSDDNDFEEVNLPFIDIEECRKKFGSPEVMPYLTDDKFCILHENDTGINKHLSGSGLTFFIGEFYYTHGVGSSSPPDQIDFSLFVNLTYHRNWITKIISREILLESLEGGS